jgi:drug/metabolite transporter (DMT)-like permease
MRIPITYLIVILLWSTTPLAIKWSGEGPGFLFGVTARMTIGLFCILLILLLRRQKLTWHRQAFMTYCAVALQIYGSMMAVYWAAQLIPSGWISVIFGLTPLMTALLAAIFLGEKSLTLGKLLSYALGVGGLSIIYGSALQFGFNALLGIGGVLLSAFLQSISSVWIKRIDASLPALSQVAGGLLLALPAYLLTWGIIDGHWPIHVSPKNLASILYLGVIATTIGFGFYYYLLTHLPATRVALISLISPPLALILGHLINHELITLKIIIGTLLILSALIFHEFFDRINRFKLNV